jgi:predicted  nucleic acid-binding Zn ribbon protein
MYTADIHFKLKRGASRHEAESAIWSFLVALLDGGNVVDHRPIAVATVRDDYRATVSLPEREALASSWHNAGIRTKKLALAEAGLKLGPVCIVGKNPDSQVVCNCRRPPALIMVLGDTPLTCSDCGGKVPLYRISRMRRHGNDHGLRYWAHRYRAVDDLWTGSDVGEQFAYRQLSQHDSDLSKLGRSTCRRIENTTGIPTYYYLYRWYARSMPSERRRTCPSCGRKWLQEPPWMDGYDFRCDRCRLVSEVGLDVR